MPSISQHTKEICASRCPSQSEIGVNFVGVLDKALICVVGGDCAWIPKYVFIQSWLVSVASMIYLFSKKKKKKKKRESKRGERIY